MSTPPPDAAAREQALDTTASYIVQAPAGSGKTSLLVSRYLALLSRVQAPEEILAVTFTRKAANEMRERVLDALRSALDDAAPPEPAKARVWRLARAVIECSRSNNWGLEANPSRLRIQTIDSLCHSLARQMPILSRFGTVPATREDAQDLYRNAARRALRHVEDDSSWREGMTALMLHLDNDHERMIDLLGLMLAKRDQWQRHLHRSGANDRQALEAALAAVIEEGLAATRDAIPADIRDELLAAVREAAGNVDPEHALASWRSLSDWPPADCSRRELWSALRALLLINDGSWRRAFNKNHGVPAPSGTKDKALKERYSALKQRFENLGEQLSRDGDHFRQALSRVSSLPKPAYSEQQWTVLRALFDVLFTASGYLQLEFITESGVDFAEVALRAVDALGDEQRPSDLALSLDYRFQHILVDEFQDTSYGQYVLLEKLTAGWMPGDGRSLFLVGDPMQSIYRFREADVGLFLRARHEGLGSVPLTPLTLTANFRSDAQVVHWVNETFVRVFPADEDIATGSVTYSPAVAMGKDGKGAVCIHPQLWRDDSEEARQVRRLVEEALAEPDNRSIAILVQARPHVALIAQELKAAGISFNAVEIESLARRPLVQDLLALLRALTHLGDGLAWLSVLRAPWIGLKLADLQLIAANSQDSTVWQALADEATQKSLSPDGLARWQRAGPIIKTALGHMAAAFYADTLRSAWLALAGPAVLGGANDLADADAFFDLVEQIEQEERAGLCERLAATLDRLYATAAGDAAGRVQIMTIHKSKGLEFDTVIVPGLGRAAASDTQRLLYWLELTSAQSAGSLLFAPIKAAGADAEPIYDYLRGIDAEKSKREQARLLYVAATRAKRQLHILGHTTCDTKDGNVRINAPKKSTLLNLLWPVVETHYAAAMEAARGTASRATADGQQDETRSNELKRISLRWQVPEPPSSLTVATAQSLSWTVREPTAIEYDWAQRPARLAGTVVHRFIKRIADEGVEHWTSARVDQLAAALNLALARLGLEGDELARAARRALAALSKVVTEQRGRWLLSSEHGERRNEWALSGVGDAGLKRIVIDRTFVTQDGVRWIIDYKTGVHWGEDVENFLDQETDRYRPQLAEYARFVRHLDSRPIRLGLYYPLLHGWREWEFNG